MRPGDTVLVTGALGFTGRYVCQALRDRGMRVFGLSNDASSDSSVHACDLRDFDGLFKVVDDIRPKYVIHLAAISFVGSTDIDQFYSVNVVGTCNLLKALEGLDPVKVIVASSANVYGYPKNSDPVDERRAPAPVNHYAASKLAMEHMVRTWYDLLPIIITRPFNYTGPGQDNRFLVPKLVEHFKLRKSQIELGNLNVSRDFSHIKDVVQCYLELLASSVNSETVNICSGHPVSLAHIMTLLESIAGYSIKVKRDNALIRVNEINVLVGSNEKLQKLIGFSPSGDIGVVLRDMLESS